MGKGAVVGARASRLHFDVHTVQRMSFTESIVSFIGQIMQRGTETCS